MKFTLWAIIALCFLTMTACSSLNPLEVDIPELKNYKVDNDKMVSAGLPTKAHFELLKSLGVKNVVDLLPEDRKEQSMLMNDLALNYHNIAVEWENPTLQNFHEYVATMNNFNSTEGVTLTHCRLNWRGSVFTYLYRVTQLHEPEDIAKQEMLNTWQPNEIWQKFIDDVLASYQGV